MSYLEYEVHHFDQPARTRYKSPYSHDWVGIVDTFDNEPEAYDFAFKLIRDGAFDVSLQVNRVTDDEIIETSVADLPCPYAELGINPLYPELAEHRDATLEALTWARIDAPWEAAELEATLKQIESEISELT